MSVKLVSMKSFNIWVLYNKMSKVAILGVIAVCVSSSVAATLYLSGDKETPSPPSAPAEEPAPSIPPGWRVEERVDYPGNDIFHYHPGSNPVASESVCLDKCASMDNCKLVTFNKSKTLCWGKNITRIDHGDRFNYFKQ